MDALLFFTNSNKLATHFCYKCLKSFSEKFLVNRSRLQFIHFMLSIKTKFLLIVKAMYFTNSVGITLIFKI